jgi:hypothetical protein
VLLGEGICAGLSVPVELDGGVIGTLDLYAGQPRNWDPGEVAALQAYAGLGGTGLRWRRRRSRNGSGSPTLPGPLDRLRASVS